MTISRTPQGTDEKKSPVVLLTLAASLIYGVSSGIRANYGILLDPISRTSGVNYASVSFVLAAAQLSFGIMQPIFGGLAMKKFSAFVLRWGSFLLPIGLPSLPFCKSPQTLLTAMWLIFPTGTAGPDLWHRHRRSDTEAALKVRLRSFWTCTAVCHEPGYFSGLCPSDNPC